MTINFRRLLGLAPLMLGVTIIGAGCEQQGPAERAGERIDQAADDVGDAFRPAGPAERAGENLDRAADNVGDALSPDGPAENAGERIDEANRVNP